MRQDRPVSLAVDHRTLNVADGENLTSCLLCFAHRRDSVGSLARLRDDDQQVGIVQHRIAVTKFRSVIDLNWYTCEPFDHVLPGKPSMPRGSARRDLYRGYRLQVFVGDVHRIEIDLARIER